MSKEAIDELKRIRSILSGITGLEDDDQEYIEDARKSVDRIIEALAEQPAQQEPLELLPVVDVCMRAEAHGIDPQTKGLYGFYVDCISSSTQPEQHRSTGKQSLQVEHPAWPAPLLQSKQNFERNFGQHWQADWIYSDLAELIDSPPPEQPATTKCWKCGDADPAFTDVCQVPACGMREQP